MSMPFHEKILQVAKLRAAGQLVEAERLKKEIQQAYPNADEATFEFTMNQMGKHLVGGLR